MIPGERWLPVVGYEGIYEVSDLGRVRSVDRVTVCKDGRTNFYRGKILSARARQNRYPTVNLSRNGSPTPQMVHRLVAIAFLGKREGDVRHKNDNKQDCRLSNLEWGTRSQNSLDAVRNGKNKNANKTHCKRGHSLSGDNLYEFAAPTGTGRIWRACVTCRRDSLARTRARGKVVGSYAR